MRKILLPFAVMGTLSLPLVACDVENTDADATDTNTQSDSDTTGTDTTPDEVTPPTYKAVIIDDSQIFPTHRTVGTDPCATASGPLFAHGADIDAVGLFTVSGATATLLGYLDGDAIDYKEGGLCPNKQNTMIDESQAAGAPNAKIDEGFVSLGGGYLTGEFTGSPSIQVGDQITVFEVGKKCGTNTNCGGTDEGYEVFVAEDIDCVNVGNGYPYSTCAVRLSDEAKGETDIPVSGF